MFSRIWTERSTHDSSIQIQRLKAALADADTVVIGAGAGLSTSAGFSYTGERFTRYFSDFSRKYDIRNMYSGGFYPFSTPEEHWAYWSRYIYINRYMDAPKPVYETLYTLIRDKDYFVLTTNVDHCFQKAGFDKKRLFYTQGDYGLFQCSEPCHAETYDNAAIILEMVQFQGYRTEGGTLTLPEGISPKMSVPTELIPYCPQCGRPMSMNLRADDTFVEDEGWHIAAGRYSDFLRKHRDMKVLFLELAVGYNTPSIIKYGFWQMTAKNPQAVYACLNQGEAYAPEGIRKQSICIDGNIGKVLTQL